MDFHAKLIKKYKNQNACMGRTLSQPHPVQPLAKIYHRAAMVPTGRACMEAAVSSEPLL